jgi:hypothetical protein
MKGAKHCGLLVFSITAVLLFGETLFCQAPQNQQECDRAGGQWTKNQLTGEFRCELPPGEPGSSGGLNPNSNAPADLSVALTWDGARPDKHNAIHVALSGDIGSRLGLEFTNEGDRTAPSGFHVAIGLFGQDPPVLKFRLRTIMNTPRVNVGQTVQDRNVRPMSIAPPVTAGIYNLCATLANGKRDCFPLQVDLAAPPPNRNSRN